VHVVINSDVSSITQRLDCHYADRTSGGLPFSFDPERHSKQTAAACGTRLVWFVTGTRRRCDFHFSVRWWSCRHNPRTFYGLRKSLGTNCLLNFLHPISTSTMWKVTSLYSQWRYRKEINKTPHILNLRTMWKWMASFTSLPLYPRRKKPWLTTESETKRVPKPMPTICRKQKSFAPTGQRNPGYPAPNLVTIPTTDNSRTRLKRQRFMRHLVYSVKCCGINYLLTV
jgi:hypothetical protein